MKVEIEEFETEEKSEYPKLMIHRTRGFVICFEQESVGTLIYSPENSHNFMQCYANVWNAKNENFIPFKGKVIFSND